MFVIQNSLCQGHQMVVLWSIVVLGKQGVWHIIFTSKNKEYHKDQNISSVEKYVHGLKPSNVSEKGKDVEKLSESSQVI